MNRTILSLAILKTHWEKHRTDYIDNFIPMLCNLFAEKKNLEVEIEAFKKDFLERYGLDIPINPLITIFRRAVKQKILRKSYGRFIINKDKLPKHDFRYESAHIERKFKNVSKSILKYAKKNYNIVPKEDEIETALLSFLKQHDLDILFAANDKSVLPEVKSTKRLKYLISAFSIYAQEYEPTTFRFLLDISIGHALSGAILYSEINSFSGKLKGLNIYIDTPLILALIGFNGEFKQKAIDELLNILYEEKANIFILATTRGEVDAILSQCQAWLEISASDVDCKILTLDDLLEHHHIFSTVVPDHVENEKFQIDETDLKKTIIETYRGIIKGFNPKDENKIQTIERDVKVLSGMYRFRQGYKPKTIKNSRDLFITSNSSLASASKIFETKGNGSSFTIPTCLTDVFLGTVIWLQSPQKVESLNEKKFIADCYAAIQPSVSLIKRYMEEVEKLNLNKKISSDEYYLLRTHRVSINLLEAKTMGDPEAFSGETVDEILDNIILSIKRTESEKLKQEKESHEETKQKLNEESDKLLNIEEKLKRKASRFAQKIGKTVFILLTVITALAIIINLFPALLNLSTKVKIGIWILIGIFTLFNLTTGFNIKGLRDKLIVMLKKKIYIWMMK